MRTKQQILKDYLSLLNEEKNLGYSQEQIDERINNKEEFEVLKGLLDDELLGTKEISGQLVSTLRAFKIYCSIVLKDDIKTGRFIWNNFFKRQFILVENNKQACYMAHRGSGKSFFAAIYISFKMYLLDNYDVCYCSNVPKQKKRWMKTFRSLIDYNEWLLERKDIKGVGSKSIPWGQEEIEYNGGTLEGTTVGTTPRGGHYNLVWGDDPLRDDKKYTDEFILDYFQGVLKPTTYTKRARYVIVGTPQHGEDLFHTLMNDKLDKNNRPIGKTVVGKISAAGFYSEIFPAILDDKKEIVLIPEIWTYEGLIVERGRIGDIRFTREMLCRCTFFRNSLISSSLFRSCCDEKLQMIQKGEPGKKYVIFIDSATSDAPTADYCAMNVWEDDAKNNKFIFRNLFHEKGYPIIDPEGGKDDQIHKAERLYNDFNKALMVVEKNNAGISLIQGLQAKGIEVIEHFTHTSATGRPTLKTGKVDDVVDYIEQGLKTSVVVFPSDPDDIYTIDALEKIKTEHLNFGVKKGKSGEKYEALAGHDDIFDASWGAFKHRGDQVDTLPFAITMSGTQTN